MKYCGTTKGNQWTTENTNLILHPKDVDLLARNGGSLRLDIDTLPPPSADGGRSPTEIQHVALMPDATDLGTQLPSMNVDMATKIRFPDLIRESTLDLPMRVLIAIAGTFALPFSRVVGLLLLIPCVLFGVHSLIVAIRNANTRAKWANSFASSINYRELKKLILKEPKRYTLHVQYYGGFDALRLCPAAILQDNHSGELLAIHPASYRTVDICETLGTPVMP